MNAEGSPQGPGQVRRILLVEDEADIRDAMKDLLEASLSGVRVTTAASGVEALQRLAGDAPHLIISDYKMPGMNGLDFLKAARSSAPGASRILMTAFPDLDVALKAINEAHIESFFPKPLDVHEVIQRIERSLDRSQSRQQRDLAMARAMRLAATSKPDGGAPTA